MTHLYKCMKPPQVERFYAYMMTFCMGGIWCEKSRHRSHGSDKVFLYLATITLTIVGSTLNAISTFLFIPAIYPENWCLCANLPVRILKLLTGQDFFILATITLTLSRFHSHQSQSQPPYLYQWSIHEFWCQYVKGFSSYYTYNIHSCINFLNYTIWLHYYSAKND